MGWDGGLTWYICDIHARITELFTLVNAIYISKRALSDAYMIYWPRSIFPFPGLYSSFQVFD